jgi:Ca2+-transporting ATPase
MERPPRAPDEGVLDREAPGEILYYGGAITLATLLAYLHGLYWHGLYPAGYVTLAQALSTLGDGRFWAAADIRVAQTMAFVTLALSQLVHALNCRNRRVSLFRLGLLGNPRLAGAIALSVLAQIVVVYVPLLQPVFRTVPITGRDLVVMLALSCVPLIAGEARKYWLRRRPSVPPLPTPHKVA